MIITNFTITEGFETGKHLILLPAVDIYFSIL